MNDKKIIVGVTGSVAAFKSALLVRELQRRGATVRVAMTESATHFVTPLTFSSLTRHEVALNLYPDPEQSNSAGSWHVEWGLWADAMIIAPASANTIARLAAGLSDNALTVIATALRGKLFIAPAMDHDMHRFPAVRRNLATLRSWETTIIPSVVGELASGIVGEGRMADPDDIIETVDRYFNRPRSLRGRTVLITAGPTHEPIDPVRYISNHSSGRMGYELAREARRRGARVTLVTGPTELTPPGGLDIVRVTSASEMETAVNAYADAADIIIAAAAVADFAPTEQFGSKLKRREMAEEELQLKLKRTSDILKSLGEKKPENQCLVGFALESHNLLISAREKLAEKNCDLIVANPANEEGAGFGVSTNRITLVSRDREVSLPMMTKRECAAAIIDEIERQRPDFVSEEIAGADSIEEESEDGE